MEKVSQGDVAERRLGIPPKPQGAGWLAARLALAAGVLASCGHASTGPTRPPSSAADGSAAPPGGRAATPPVAAAIEHAPRLFFSDERVAALRRGARVGTPAWRRTLANCEEEAAAPIAAGYEAWSWAHALASLVTCWKATSDPYYRSAAVGYFRALLDDRRRFGDGAGGEHVVEHDEGYCIRTFGVFAALGYDWLRDAPEVTEEIRAEAAARLDAWTSFYRERGYLRDQPISNHFIGYFLATATAAIALHGDSPRAEEELHHAREDLFERLIRPTFAATLSGGDWPESWQYGDLVALALAIYADAERRLDGGRDVFAELPWLHDVVRERTHATLPDGVHAYDGGDWSEKPPRMPATSLWALATLLPEGDPARAESLGLARALGVDHPEEAWIAAVADDPSAVSSDPRHGPTSLFLPGTGLTLARSAWSKDAVFVSFQSGPTVTPDHQHSDQGHFSIVRDEDPLLVDSGEYGAASTMSHNSILVDDGGDALEYGPNQGRWGTASRTTRFIDAGDYVAVRGDFGDAYRPSPDAGRSPSVRAVLRDLVFVRPGLVVIRDRVRVSKPTYGVTWAVHGATQPVVDPGGASFRIENGASRADVSVLDPPHARAILKGEPSPSGDGAWFGNQPWQAHATRVEVSSPKGSTSRSFLAVIRVGSVAEPRSAPRFLGEESGVVGALVPVARAAPQMIAFVDDQSARRAVHIGGPPSRSDLVIGLAPDANYAILAEGAGERCRVTIRPGEGRTATRAGTLAYVLERCILR